MRPANGDEVAVIAFLESMGPTWSEFQAGYATWMTEDVLWENTGFPAIRGRDKSIRFLGKLHDATGMEYCTIDVHNISSRDGVVLTERTDRMHRADGSVILEFAIMGAFEVRDGRIARYSDHFSDTEFKRAFPALAG